MQNIKVFLITVLISLIVTSSLWSQGQIRGTVRVNSGTDYIVGAIVYAFPVDKTKRKASKTITAISQQDGSFLIEDLPAGIYNLECYASGFVTQRILGFEIKENKTKLAYFRMRSGNANEQGVDEVLTYAALQAKQSQSVSVASQSAQELIDAPAQVYLVTKDDIESRGYQSIADVFEDIPEINLYMNTDPEVFNTVASRGVAGNEKFLVMVNGIRQSSYSSTSMMLEKNFPIHFVKQVEVLIGPVSALYGADAFSGVINIVTETGNRIKGAKLQTSYGMYQTTDNAFIIGGGNRKANYNIRANFFHTANPFMPDFYAEEYDWYLNAYQTEGFVRQSPFFPDTTNVEPQAYNMLRQNYNIAADFNINDFEIGVSHRQEYHSSATAAAPAFYPPTAQNRYGTSLSTAFIRHKLKKPASKWQLQSILNANYYEIKPSSGFFNSFSSYQKVYKFGYDVNVGIREILSYKFNEKHSLITGISALYTNALPKTSDLPFRWTRGEDRSGTVQYYVGTDVEDSDGNNLEIYQSLFFLNRFNIGGFVQHQAKWSPKLETVISGRIDYNSDYGWAGNPRLAIIYKPMKTWRLKLMYGSAFLAPSPQREFDHFGSLEPVFSGTDDIIGFEGGFWRLPNEDLRPERLQTLELGSVLVKGNISLQINAYASYAQQLIERELSFDEVFRGILIRVAERPQNSGQAIFAGGTAMLNYETTFGEENAWVLKTFVGAALNQSTAISSGSIELDFGSSLGVAPYRALGGFNLRYKQFSAFIRGQYSAAINLEQPNALGRDQIPAFWRLDSHLKYRMQLAKMPINCFIHIQNLTNNRYYHPTLGNAANWGASPQDPINIRVGVQLELDFQ